MAIINVRNIIIGIVCGVIIWGFIANVPNCSSHPCLNGATCMESSSRSGFTCLCPAPYTGIDCGTRVLRCSSSPCLNGATCMESSSGSGYTCLCPAPYTGRDCGTRVPSCSSNPCLNGATCMESRSGSGYTCLCPAPYTGIDCGTRVPSCSSNPCLNGATCMESSSGPRYSCICPAPYTGIDCGTRVLSCSSNPCLNRAICIESSLGPGYFCHCSERYTGTACETRVLSCSSSPCLNGATCIESNSGPWYVCRCPASYTGRDCRTRDEEKSILPILLVLIVIAICGLCRLVNKAETTEKRFRSQKQAQPRRRVQGPLLKRCGLDDDFTRQLHLETQIRQLRAKIIDYRPGEWTLRDVGVNFKRPPMIRLGVFGVTCSGKSTLLNSLHFSLTDTWTEIYTEGQNFGLGEETVFRGFMKLTNHVTTVDTRAISDFSAQRVNDVMAEISGNRGIAPNRRHRSEKIDCPIFVFKYSVDTGTLPSMKCLSIIVDETKKRFYAYPIMVLTFGDSVVDKDQILYEIIHTGMPRSNVFFIENYTKDNHEMIKERHVALLEILEACILRADDNMTFLWSKEPCWKKVMNAIVR